MSQTTQVRKPLLCKYCNQVPITFSKGRVSRAGKLMPLNANSLEPHSCSMNPYFQSQQSGKGILAKRVTPAEKQVPPQKTTVNQLLYEILFEVQELQSQIRELQDKVVYADRK